MFIVIPIRTESAIRRTPIVNHALIGLNILLFLLFNERLAIPVLQAVKTQYLVLHADEPTLYQFFTYQFLHADAMHLLGNLLFLWVFGNSVNAKMGHGPYLLFYLAGGVFAAWGYALFAPEPSHLLGASGAIAAITTAYLALYPRSRVTVLVWLFIFIHFLELPAMVIIVLKVIVWDNIVAPNLSHSQTAIAHSAHLAGYLFGFVGALGMLLIRALPRDQFDMLALWKRWNRRREFAAAMSDPQAAGQAQYGSAAGAASVDPKVREAEDRRLDQIAHLRSDIAGAFDENDSAGAQAAYEQLLALDARQCLSERHQLQIARHLYSVGRFNEAAEAFQRFVECYPNVSDAADVRLLLGIIYARDLRQYDAADKHLTESMTTLRDEARRLQCRQWLTTVRQALGRSAPEPSS